MMNRSRFQDYLDNLRAHMTQSADEPDENMFYYEACLPSYTSSNPLVKWLFWQRLSTIVTYLENRPRPEVALDFGCGLGVMLPFLQEHAGTVLACDVHTQHLERISSTNQWTNVTCYQQLDAIAKDHAGHVDVILALDVLEHVDDLDHIIKTFADLLRPGGEVVISGPTENWFYRLGRRVAGYSYESEHHVRNIYDIRDGMLDRFAVQTIATLYYPLPLFKLYAARLPA